MGDIVELQPTHRHGQPGYHALADLPQRQSIEETAFSTGWWELDQVLKIYMGQFIVVTGVAGHGKSTFVQNLIVNLAREKELASFMYVPENEGHLRDKMQRLWKSDKSFGHFASSLCFLQSAIPTRYDEPPHTIDWVLQQAVVAIERDGCKIVLIDPWNELERAKPPAMLMTDHIGECLMRLKAFTRSFEVCTIVIAHPTKAVTENGGRVPMLSDIEGSMNWFNKADNGLIVHRGDGDKANTCRVISAKVRELGAGKRGTVHFQVDPSTGIFTPDLGGVTP